MPPRNESIVLTPHCSLKMLEEPYLYDRDNDELYELSQDGFDFFVKCSLG